MPRRRWSFDQVRQTKPIYNDYMWLNLNNSFKWQRGGPWYSHFKLIALLLSKDRWAATEIVSQKPEDFSI